MVVKKTNTPKVSFRPNTNKHFPLFLQWIVHRMEIFWKRYYEMPPPWTDDSILRQYKFTNVYRVLDRSSQYLLNDVIYNGRHYNDEDMLWRILLYKHFNSPSTWSYLRYSVGEITLNTPLHIISDRLTALHNRPHSRPIYSNAYMLTASFIPKEDPRPKHQIYIELLWNEIIANGLWRKILDSETFEECFNHLRGVKTIGGFLAYQFVQDLNYSNLVDFDNNSFCFPGPGTIRGVSRVFDFDFTKNTESNVADAVIWTYHNIIGLLKHHGMFLKFSPLPNFWPQVPDICNCFCETDKYMRAMNIQQEGVKRTRLKNTFKPNTNRIKYTLPPKWGIKILEL